MERSSVSEKMLSNERVDVKKQAYITPAFSNLDKIQLIYRSIRTRFEISSFSFASGSFTIPPKGIWPISR